MGRGRPSLHETRSPGELRAKKRGPRGAQLALLGADAVTGKTSTQRYYARHADKERQRSRTYKQAHPDVGWVKIKAYRATENGKAALRRIRLKKKYGITPSQWDALARCAGRSLRNLRHGQPRSVSSSTTCTARRPYAACSVTAATQPSDS